MKILVLDFETKDPYIGRGLGAGWTYALNNGYSDFLLVGFSYCTYDSEEDTISDSQYVPIDWKDTYHSRKNFLLEQLEKSDAVCMHNAPYDLGCLKVLGIDIANTKILDTKVIAKLVNPLEYSFSLDFLSKKYCRTGEQKSIDGFVNGCIEAGIVDHLKPKRKDFNVARFHQKVKTWAYQNMHVIQENAFHVIEEYANQDTIATAKLLQFQLQRINIKDAIYWSGFQHICVHLRTKGIRISMDALREGMDKLRPVVEEKERVAHESLGSEECNLNSPTQVQLALRKMGVKLPPAAIKGHFKTDKLTLMKLAQKGLKAAQDVLDYREAHKLYHDFFVKVLEMQEYTCPEALVEGAKYGRVFPDYNLFGAATGRFSCSNPNIQQIPKRNKVWGPLIRAIFVPDEGKNKWYSLDWANQEGRLQVHYAAKIGAEGAEEIVQEFTDNPCLDLHQKVADLANITRAQAKPINLGLSYGMGPGKLCRSLNLPTKFVTLRNGAKAEVAGEEGQKILDSYHAGAPFISQLAMQAKTTLNSRGYIVTLGGRRLPRDPERNYLGLSKLIQGSAADQMLLALKAAYETGIDIKCVVHDEFNIEGSDKDALAMKKIMESVVNLKVPMVAEVSCGDNWGNINEINDLVK